MFVPKSFEITDTNLIYEWMESYSFATLVSSNKDQIEASHLPLFLDKDKKYLIGHMAKNNIQWQNLAEKSVLSIFQGPHHYISPSWYETKDAVPTWNYIAIHVYGTFKIIENKEEVKKSLVTLTSKYESKDSRYKLDSADPQYLENLQKGIVGFKIQIERLEAKAKLSQNHSKNRQLLVKEELKKLKNENAQAIAHWMEMNLNSYHTD